MQLHNFLFCFDAILVVQKYTKVWLTYLPSAAKMYSYMTG